MTDDINDVSHTSTLAANNEAVRRDERARVDVDTAEACENTDRHLWPQTSEDAYAPTLFVTANGEGIGINVGGSVYVKTLREWHRLAGGPIGIRSEAATPLDREVRLYDALKQRAAQARWMPIETVPKDGTTISVWHRMWNCPVSVRYVVSNAPCKWVEATLTTQWPDDAFTHWQPLAASPVSSTDRRTQEVERFPPNETPMMPMPPEGWDAGEEVNDAWLPALPRTRTND